MRDRRYPKSRLCVFIISVLTLIILICLLLDRIFHRQPTLLPDLPPDSIVLMFIGSMIALFIAGYSSPYNARVLNEMEKKEEMDCLADAEGLLHLSGLSVPAQTDCHVYLNRGGLIVECASARFNIPASNITDISFMDLSQVRKHYVDNASGAIAGGLMFGALGALFMGGTKEITEVNEQYFLAVSYVSSDSGAEKGLCFQAPPKYVGGAAQVASRWKKDNTPKSVPDSRKRNITL